jgi:hypothetical protein
MSPLDRRTLIVGSALVAAVASTTEAEATIPPPTTRVWADENARNAKGGDLFKAIIMEVYGADQFVAAHHLIFTKNGEIQELPSADMMIFDHDIAKVIWGSGYKEVLAKLAVVPIETRDELLGELYAARGKG